MKIYTTSDEGHILNEDLTTITTDPKTLAPLYQQLDVLMRLRKGVGVAANQIGIRANFFFAGSGANLNKGGAGEICVNPSWKPHASGSEMTIIGEGCLSFPGQLFSVKRWTVISATWQNTQGHWRRDVKLRGIAAQMFQHEHDHLRGITLEQSGQRLRIAQPQEVSP